MSKQLLATPGRVVLKPLEDRAPAPDAIRITVPNASRKGVMLGEVVDPGDVAVSLGEVFAFDDAEASLVVIDRIDYYIVACGNLLARVVDAEQAKEA